MVKGFMYVNNGKLIYMLSNDVEYFKNKIFLDSFFSINAYI